MGIAAAMLLMRRPDRSKDNTDDPGWAYKGKPVAPTPAAPDTPQVAETVTVALRRQIPVDHETPATSWLGGWPRMPTYVRWPANLYPNDRMRGTVPLHFVAQIDCAALPDNLWGGLGPRKGWLLLFIDAGEDNLDKTRVGGRPVQVLHVGERRPQPDPPKGLHGIRAGEDNMRFYRSSAETPNHWRKWPVDLVRFDRGSSDEAASSDTDITSETLYPDAPVDHDAATFTDADGIMDPANWPFTWRGALFAVDRLIRSAHDILDKSTTVQPDEWRGDLTWFEQLLPTMKGRLAGLVQTYETASASDDEADRKRIAPLETEIARLKASIAFVEQFDRLEQLNTALDAAISKQSRWLHNLPSYLQRIRDDVLEHDLDRPMSEDDFRPILTRLLDGYAVVWKKHPLETPDGLIVPQQMRIGLPEATVQQALDDGQRVVAADLFTSSAEAAAKIPPDLRARLEARWRHLTHGHAHRMGHRPDGDSTAPEGDNASDLLLFQLASDESMDMHWPGGRTICVFIAPADLAAMRFDRIRFTLTAA